MSTSIYTIASAMTINGKQLFGYSDTFDSIYSINTAYGFTYLADAVHQYNVAHFIDLDRNLSDEEKSLYRAMREEAEMIEETIDAYNWIWEERGVDHEITSAEYMEEIA